MVKQICSKHGYPFIGGEECPDCVKGADPKLGERTVPVLAEAATRMPVYYRLPGLFLADGSPADAMHLVENAWPDCDNFCEKDVLKYLLRAGSKPGVPAERDWLKIVRVAARKYRRLSGEDLPDDI